MPVTVKFVTVLVSHCVPEPTINSGNVIEPAPKAIALVFELLEKKNAGVNVNPPVVNVPYVKVNDALLTPLVEVNASNIVNDVPGVLLTITVGNVLPALVRFCVLPPENTNVPVLDNVVPDPFVQLPTIMF